MPVDSTRIEVSRRKPRWDLVDDAVNADIKEPERAKTYLPVPNPSDDSEENKVRYEQYTNRAVYYNFVKRTLEGLRGTVMDQEAEVALPTGLEHLIDDVDGNGLSLEQQVRETLGGVLTKGRYGLLGSFPEVNFSRVEGEEGFISQADVAALNLRPYITTYHPNDIINWDEDRVGATRLLVLVVLREFYNDARDEFEHSVQEQYRVLRLAMMTEEKADMAGIEVPAEAVYYQEVWREGEITQIVVPTQADGSYFGRIPFEFVGSEDNSPRVDDIPLYDLAAINIGHYRNSADYEESSFLVGQPQVTAVGMTEHWIENVWQGQMYFGSRAVLTGPDGASFQILQAMPNSMPMEGMKHKEEVMIKLGAQIVAPDTTRRTATEVITENRSDNSVLSSIAGNVSDAYESMLRHLALFSGDGVDGITYRLNRDYGARDATPELIGAWLGALAQGAMSLRTFLSNMQRGGQLPADTTLEQEMRRIENGQQGGSDLGDVDSLPDNGTVDETVDENTPPENNE